MRTTDTVLLKCLLFEGTRTCQEIWFTSQFRYWATYFACHIVQVFVENNPWKFLFPVWKELTLNSRLWGRLLSFIKLRSFCSSLLSCFAAGLVSWVVYSFQLRSTGGGFKERQDASLLWTWAVSFPACRRNWNLLRCLRRKPCYWNKMVRNVPRLRSAVQVSTPWPKYVYRIGHFIIQSW